MTDRVKEHLFERLGPFDGERVLDVFAGTGTIGLEALSRGGASVVFLERDHRAFELLRANVEHLGVTDETLCWRTDVLRCSFRPKGRDELLPYDRIFFDPPYAIAGDIRLGTPLFKSLERLARPDISSDDVELVLRIPLRQTIELPRAWHDSERLEMGGMAIHRLHRPSAEEQGSPPEAV